MLVKPWMCTCFLSYEGRDHEADSSLFPSRASDPPSRQIAYYKFEVGAKTGILGTPTLDEPDGADAFAHFGIIVGSF